jgi:hypothetical protein
LAVSEELWVSDCSKGLDCKNLDICYTFPLYGELQKAINGILKIYTLDKVK